MMIVTGAAGFIGSNIVMALNKRGVHDVVVVDNLARADKFRNLVDAEISDYVDKADFLERLAEFKHVDAIFHQGACSDTMESDGRYMMANNYTYSLRLLEHAQANGIPFYYASSAAVYGGGQVFAEQRDLEGPLNVYGYSKFLFDQIVRRRMATGLRAPVVGLRYFNVYGPRESHKGRMASVAFHHVNQYRERGYVELFGAWDGYGSGEQSRDFVFVDDAVAVNLHFLDNPQASGIFNCGSGRAQPFNDVASTVVNTLRQQRGKATMTLDELVASGEIRYIDFPDALKGKYQSFTRADRSQLVAAGCSHEFATVEHGVEHYVKWLTRDD